MADYTLTVAVSIAASVAALVSAFPALHTHRVGLGVAFILLVTVLNLRGIRESGSIFAVPTYLFLIGMFIMIAVGFARTAANGFEAEAVPTEAHDLAGTGALTIFRRPAGLQLRVFGDDRCRGHLGRRACLQSAGMA